jgi:hypothetical protein
LVLLGILAVTVSVDTAQFVALVRSSENELRDRFGLAATCEPAMSATRRGPRRPIEVKIQCAETSQGEREPAERAATPAHRSR